LEEAKEIFGGDDFNFDEFYRDDDGELGDEDDEYPEVIRVYYLILFKINLFVTILG
jgi:hypothetical protein